MPLNHFAENLAFFKVARRHCHDGERQQQHGDSLHKNQEFRHCKTKIRTSSAVLPASLQRESFDSLAGQTKSGKHCQNN